MVVEGAVVLDFGGGFSVGEGYVVAVVLEGGWAVVCTLMAGG